MSWKGYQQDITNDKTGRFKFIPSISDGQFLFMQHLVSKLNNTGIGVVVHNGSTLFSGDAGSNESDIRKWLFELDIVESIIQLPTDEFFNTPIYTYLWVLNKNKKQNRRDNVLILNASEMFSPLMKSKGKKRREINHDSRINIVKALERYEENDHAKVFEKDHFYFNKQFIQLTNVDENGKTFEDELDGQKSKKLKPSMISTGKQNFTEFMITEFDTGTYESLKEYFNDVIKPTMGALDYKEQPIRVETDTATYSFDTDKETLIEEATGRRKELGCGKIVIKSVYKKKTKRLPERIEITCELMPDYQKDYEVIPFHREEATNRKRIEDFMAKHVTKPFEYLENLVGVEINFNKVFCKPTKLRSTSEILAEIRGVDQVLKDLESDLVLR